MNWRRTLAWLPVLMLSSSVCLAQDSSLLGNNDTSQGSAQPLTMSETSFLYNPLPPSAQQRELKVRDKIIVLVDYRTTMLSEGEAESRKTASHNSVLSDWLKFDGGDLFPAPQLRGDPRISGSLNSQFRAESEIESRDSLTFRIAAEIVGTRPNGDLVIEAHQKISVNEEVWIQSLSGVVARKFILPDNTVRSDSIAHLHIKKHEQGQVRDGYTRGWLNRAYSRVRPF